MSFTTLGHTTGSALDIRAMRIFVAVAEAGSFVAGGKAMGLTRSSNRVKR
ncbi:MULTISPECIES: LysR family transcriptional regulator [Pantoea]|nr:MULTISPECIES: LysR family transcriptional regulator [Pantoea]